MIIGPACCRINGSVIEPLVPLGFCLWNLWLNLLCKCVTGLPWKPLHDEFCSVLVTKYHRIYMTGYYQCTLSVQDGMTGLIMVTSVKGKFCQRNIKPLTSWIFSSFITLHVQWCLDHCRDLEQLDTHNFSHITHGITSVCTLFLFILKYIYFLGIYQKGHNIFRPLQRLGNVELSQLFTYYTWNYIVVYIILSSSML